MNADRRLSAILHVVLHMAESRVPVTSEALAAHMRANPVQVRRVMAGLRKAGLVRSARGHGGGWELACELSAVTMRDVFAAIGSPPLFAIGHRSDNPACLVEQAVNSALDGTLSAAEQLILDRLGSVTLADLSADFHRRAVETGQSWPKVT
jgi:Rrf2 family protein